MEKEDVCILFTDEAAAFLRSIPEQARNKFAFNIGRIKGGEKNSEIFKKLENTEIWEFRVLCNKIAYRLFAFWDTDSQTLIVATHGIIKKTQKTPPKEIRKAERIRKDYLNNK
ncbi:MAG: type II toxin-antitoxin system RelE/ParE family toxin [Bacteroidales bacterium]|nr:type II toxin-antitoxin system RelE/ParE family toxin [Bacteroidales bacterium]MCQ2608065.1 type II toxin-antitoxin system RelE/ParE family toxin [Bacteroidales bacterium]MCQ2959025.1 type II toxin-antitoxin system RelE/ParE family toxin [Bacteroidales bacterium]